MSYLKQPASGLVRLALDRWQLRGMRADNISVIVILLDSGVDVSQPAVPKTAKCRDPYRLPKEVLRRVRHRHRRRVGLRTVLGKICRLRAQRNLASVCIVRPPLGTWNRLSAVQQRQDCGAARPTMGDEIVPRRPVRRRSYQEACADVDDPERTSVQRRHLRVLVRRLSADLGRSCKDLTGDTGGGTRNIEDDMSPDDDTFQESVLRLSENRGAETNPTQILGTTADSETDDDGWDISQWQSTVDLCSPTADES